MRVLPLFALSLLALACGTSPPRCDPSSCTGCCSPAGVCEAGDTVLSCGALGASCALCSVGQGCRLGACGTLSGGAGGGTGAGGGGSTGGGDGGGGSATGGGGGSATGGGAPTGGGTPTGGGGANTSGGGTGGGLGVGLDAGNELQFRLFVNPVGTHDCAVYDTGEVWCWGLTNEYGQIGSGTAQYPKGMLPVRGLPPGVISVAPGGDHTCALTNQGAVWCWGLNVHGQLGTGSTLNSSAPVHVVGLPDCTSIAAGYQHSCALTTAGAVWCWGSNGEGQVGVTQTVDQLVPVAVPGLGSSAQALRLGATVSCAELGQGSVRCWGTPLQGMKTGPIDPGLSNVASLSVGVGHACATSGTRAAWCWGSNTSGELGTGTLTSTPTPQLVGGAQLPWVSVGSGSSHTCGLVADGTVRCWGSPSYGLLGNGTGGTQLQPLPAPVVGLSGVASLQVGYWGNYATVGNQVLVWGNTNLADSPAQPTRASMTPLRGRPPQRIRLGGLSNVCALLESEAWCMGFNQYGEVGNGITPADEFVGLSHVVDLPSGLLDLSVGDYHACALGSAGEVWCWGDNDQGQLGTPAPAVSSRPLRVAGLPVGVEQVVLGGDSSCALTSSGEAWCWGNGLLGSASSPSVPARVQLGGAVAQLALGAYNGCARLRSGVLKCWGSYTPSWALETVTFPSTAAVVAVDASPSTVCAVLSDGSVWCWGYNSSGEVGDGTTTHTSTPHSVLGLSQARSVSVGADQACAIKQDGTVWCWGQENRVGRGSSATSTVLAGPVPGLSNVETIDAALFTTYAVTHDGAVMCIASSVERCAL